MFLKFVFSVFFQREVSQNLVAPLLEVTKKVEKDSVIIYDLDQFQDESAEDRGGCLIGIQRRKSADQQFLVRKNGTLLRFTFGPPRTGCPKTTLGFIWFSHSPTCRVTYVRLFLGFVGVFSIFQNLPKFFSSRSFYLFARVETFWYIVVPEIFIFCGPKRFICAKKKQQKQNCNARAKAFWEILLLIDFCTR